MNAEDIKHYNELNNDAAQAEFDETSGYNDRVMIHAPEGASGYRPCYFRSKDNAQAWIDEHVDRAWHSKWTIASVELRD